MLRRLSIGLLASAIAIGPLPTKAQDGTAEDLGDVMRISLKDVVKPSIGFQGALQGAGTPNQTGIGGFLPLSVGENSVWFLDALVNLDFEDFEDYSSIINTDVAGGFSTSTRLGYRWLNGDRSWMYGLNAGYDTRTIRSGNADTGIPVPDKQTVFFNQIAVNAEAVSNDWKFNVYGLIPIGDVEQKLNFVYNAGALNTYGLDIGYFITPSLKASIGYYYQHRDEEYVNGSGVSGRLAYEIFDGLTLGANVSYDEAFETRVSADIAWRLRLKGHTSESNGSKKAAIDSLSSSPSNRNVRVHDWTIDCRSTFLFQRNDDYDCIPRQCRKADATPNELGDSPGIYITPHPRVLPNVQVYCENYPEAVAASSEGG